MDDPQKALLDRVKMVSGVGGGGYVRQRSMNDFKLKKKKHYILRSTISKISKYSLSSSVVASLKI